MFKVPKEQEIDSLLLSRFIDKHKAEIRSRYKDLKDAYESDHEILHMPAKPRYKPDNRIVVNFPKYIADTMNGFFIGNPIKITADSPKVSEYHMPAKPRYKPDNRIVVNFPKYIADTMNGFFIGNPIKITADSPKVSEYIEYLDKYNSQDDSNAELSKIASIFGKAFEMYYTDEDGQLCTVHLSPMDAFMIYDDGIVERPKAFVRLYTDLEGIEKGSISDADTIRYFQTTGSFRWIGEEENHLFDGVPANEFVENEERQGIFEPISDADTIRYFQTTGSFRWIGEEENHLFDGVPANEFVENEERQGIFEPVMSMVNAYYFQTTGSFRWIGEEENHLFDGVPANEFVENEERQGIFEPVMSMVNAYQRLTART